ncbi:hypothetical protein [Actinoplanes rectilineatus]|uniref:hypothetical protein n=1 Tax=Actinoplanes rectilineatus TaxID=113571 RepID=UPI000B18E875|nr:hypothetical protein [Actinoplanes rectilineatus]
MAAVVFGFAALATARARTPGPALSILISWTAVAATVEALMRRPMRLPVLPFAALAAVLACQQGARAVAMMLGSAGVVHGTIAVMSVPSRRIRTGRARNTRQPRTTPDHRFRATGRGT